MILSACNARHGLSRLLIAWLGLGAVSGCAVHEKRIFVDCPQGQVEIIREDRETRAPAY